MNISQIQENLENILSSFREESFIFELLLAYGIPRATITLLKTGKHNLSKIEGQIILKKKLYFVELRDGRDLHGTIDAISKDEASYRHDPRFIIVTDYHTLLAIDTKTKERKEMLLQIDPDPKQKLQTFDKHFDFFLPWAWMEKSKYKSENPADIKAAYTLAKLYDAIREDNNLSSPGEIHALNVFLSRILFCFFAEDTEIFPKDIFTYSLESHTQEDGSDLHTYLEKLFGILDKRTEDRWNIAEYLQKFPYVNGGLFREKLVIPVFKKKSRSILIECWKDLNWSEINPDIFGSMVQAVVHPDQRSGLGMHYTSVPNIMKVIQPLFLDELRSEYEKNIENPKALEKLLAWMSKIRVFDPACGSGNFLIISYKELRRLEMEILSTLYEANILTLPISHISLSQFYGIEIDDFAHEVAWLSLYIANHQMNREFQEIFLVTAPLLPLQASGNIVCANATRKDWEEVCPKEDGFEIYILGNPPYLWQRNQEESHHEDLDFVFDKLQNYKNLDYISCWFMIASRYLDKNSSFAFVTTNSIFQWTQVEMLWSKLFEFWVEIFFSYKNIKWQNNAKQNAWVTVCIVWVSKAKKKQKDIYHNNTKTSVSNINAYLIEWDNIIISKQRKPLSAIPKMEWWNQPREWWYLILSNEEKEDILKKYPETNRFIRPLIWASEFLDNIKRWCIWIDEDHVEDAREIEELKRRIDAIKSLRESWNSLERNFVNYPYRFIQNNEAKDSQIIIPVVSSEKREYLPVWFLTNDYIVLNSANVIYDSDPFIFWLLSSKIHMIWVKMVWGWLETRIRYSPIVCYNCFPFPNISLSQKEAISHNVYNILEEREKHPEKTMAELYDPDKMPDGLREAHRLLDQLIERCYRATPFKSDEERLSYLFNLYEKMVENENIKH